MRWWTIPILGAVAFSLTIPAPASARMRSGPGAVFGALAGAMFLAIGLLVSSLVTSQMIAAIVSRMAPR